MSVAGMSAHSLPNSGSVRVATLNLWGRNGAGEERRSVLTDGRRELRPDVIAFQEAVETEGYDQVIDLLGPGYHVAHQTGHQADGTDLSIASRCPMGEVQEVALHVRERATHRGLREKGGSA
jgi:hypothetical protein